MARVEFKVTIEINDEDRESTLAESNFDELLSWMEDKANQCGYSIDDTNWEYVD
jgi:hypothetical protein